MTHPNPDTIVALATGSLPSAIALVRVSGPSVADIAAELLACRLPAARHVRLTTIRAPDGRPVDQALVTAFRAPHSYTGEDMLELSVHGGRAVVDDLLGLLLARPGTRLAEPGEFTRRAFSNGKLDLTEAEAVADLIEAETPGQRDQALAQLGGSLRQTYDQWRAQLLDMRALVEVAVDFPDESDAPDATDVPVLERLLRLESELSSALADDGIGERIRDGFRIALIGAPTAGKSSLLNRLAGRDAAIVTDIPGTTRDVIEVRMRLGEHLALVNDTAGLRDSADMIEAEGIRRARFVAAEADLRILVVDGADPGATDLSLLKPDDLVVLNKVDLGPVQPPDVSRETLVISAKTGAGIDTLVDRISARIKTRVALTPSPVITRARHRAGLAAACRHLGEARTALETGHGAEFAAEDIRRAIRELSGLMGGIDVEDVLGAVFSEFCIGK